MELDRAEYIQLLTLQRIDLRSKLELTQLRQRSGCTWAVRVDVQDSVSEADNFIKAEC